MHGEISVMVHLYSDSRLGINATVPSGTTPHVWLPERLGTISSVTIAHKDRVFDGGEKTLKSSLRVLKLEAGSWSVNATFFGGGA